MLLGKINLIKTTNLSLSELFNKFIQNNYLILSIDMASHNAEQPKNLKVIFSLRT